MSRTPFLVAPLGLVALLALPASAAGRQKPISGELSRPGYTVIALAADGKATSAGPKGRRFRLRPAARRVTLHLRASNGKYAGPIVMRRERGGKRVVLGVRAGARLAGIRVGRGYAKLAKRPRQRSIDTSFWAQARKGVPLGTGRFGHVRSRYGAAVRKRVRTLQRKLSRARSKLRRARSTRSRRLLRRQIRTLTRKISQARLPAGDPDLDGTPDPLDIDDDGDLVLDSLDRNSGARAAQAEVERFDVLTGLGLSVDASANVHAVGTGPPLTTAQIDPALSGSGRLLMEILPGDSPEIDCAGDPTADPPRPGLRYCSSGGSGRIFQPGVDTPASPRFPECCDADTDGFGTPFEDPTDPKPTPFFMLTHGATTSEIGTGDVLIERVRRDGKELQFPATLQFVFATVPALASYGDTAGNSVTVPYPYPVRGPIPIPPGPGTRENPFPAAGGLDGNVVLTLTYWRPQRIPLRGEQGEWTDIGGLHYQTVVGHVGPPGTPPGGTTVNKPCPQSSYSVPPDQPLGPSQAGPEHPGLIDQLRQPVNGSKLTYSLNLSQCLASLGRPWNAGEQVDIQFNANLPESAAAATQGMTFKRIG